MLERLLIVLALGLLSAAAFALFRYAHLRRASQLAPIAGKPVLIYFRSDACAPCVAQGHYVQQVESEFGDRIAIQKVDADKEPVTAERYGIFTVPTTLIVDAGGQVKHANYGLADASRLANQLFAQESGARA